MRFWHVDLLEFLPRQQLVNQWREVCQVAKNMALNGTTGNVLTERVMDYPPEHLQAYAEAVMNEMAIRGSLRSGIRCRRVLNFRRRSFRSGSRGGISFRICTSCRSCLTVRRFLQRSGWSWMS